METTIHDDPDDIVISGISGKFPESDSMKEFQDNLFNKVDLGTDDERRWLHGNIYINKKFFKFRYTCDLYYKETEIQSHQSI